MHDFEGSKNLLVNFNLSGQRITINPQKSRKYLTTKKYLTKNRFIHLIECSPKKCSQQQRHQMSDRKLDRLCRHYTSCINFSFRIPAAKFISFSIFLHFEFIVADNSIWNILSRTLVCVDRKALPTFRVSEFLVCEVRCRGW